VHTNKQYAGEYEAKELPSQKQLICAGDRKTQELAKTGEIIASHGYQSL